MNSINVANIVSPPPDLQITSVTSPSNALAGEALTIHWSGKNFGNGAVPNSSWNDAVYFSTDTTLDGTDTQLAVKLIAGPVAAGSTYLGEVQVILPQVNAGNYYLIVKADDNNFVSEGQREDNNTNSTAIPILLPGIDLQVSAVSVPPTAQSGQNITVHWGVTKNGTLQTFTNGWTDNVILSRDQILDSTDRVIGFAQHNGVLAGDANYDASTLLLKRRALVLRVSS